MAKDPAFLFYPEKFINGTLFMTDEQTGKYIKLLCHQHQNGGMINKDDFENFVGDDIKIRAKFVETEDGYFNEKLMLEIEKRKKKSNNLSANAKVRWDEHKQKQCKSNAIAFGLDMPTINKDIDVNKDINKNKEVKKKYGEYSHVLLTDLQHEKLVADFGRKKAEQLIKRLDEYIQMKGAKYKDHNLVMRNWERKDSESSVDKPMREL